MWKRRRIRSEHLSGPDNAPAAGRLQRTREISALCPKNIHLQKFSEASEERGNGHLGRKTAKWIGGGVSSPSVVECRGVNRREYVTRFSLRQQGKHTTGGQSSATFMFESSNRGQAVKYDKYNKIHL